MLRKRKRQRRAARPWTDNRASHALAIKRLDENRRPKTVNIRKIRLHFSPPKPPQTASTIQLILTLIESKLHKSEQPCKVTDTATSAGRQKTDQLQGNAVQPCLMSTPDTQPILPQSEHLLIALVGLTPAVLTETVYALCQNKDEEIPDRILIITTEQGRKRLIESLFEQDGWEELLHRLKIEIGAETIKGKLRFGPVEDCIRLIPSLERDRNLTDIRTLEDNLAVGEFIMDTLRGPCENADVQITASLAGGRKTMGALLLSAMSLLGRFSDQLVHVLVDDPWDRIPGFLFPGCKGRFSHPNTKEPLDSSSARLTLAKVPFVPLRYIFKEEIGKFTGNYKHLIERLRRQAAGIEIKTHIEIDLKRGRVKISDTIIPTSDKEFAFYATLAQRAADALPPLRQYRELEEPVQAFTKKHHCPDIFSHWSNLVVEAPMDPKEDFRRHASSLRAHLRAAGFNDIQINRLLPEKGRISINLRPDNIIFVS